MRTQSFTQENPIFNPHTGQMLEATPARSEPALDGASPVDREALILQHLSTVRFIARRVYERLPQHMELDDLISAGLVGLMDAASKFDSKKEVQFASYAQFRIRGAIVDSLRLLDWSPRELRRQGRAMAEAIRSLSTRLGRSPSDAEVADEMGMNLHEYQHMTGDLKGLEIGSLNADRTEESGEEEVDYVPTSEEANPLALCIAGQDRQQLAAALAQLPEKERLVLTLSYFEELTMREIGLTLGIGESRVCQIRASALKRLRAAFGVTAATPAPEKACTRWN